VLEADDLGPLPFVDTVRELPPCAAIRLPEPVDDPEPQAPVGEGRERLPSTGVEPDAELPADGDEEGESILVAVRLEVLVSAAERIIERSSAEFLRVDPVEREPSM